MIPVANISITDLMGEVFIHSPTTEPIEKSLARLEKAIIADYYASTRRELIADDDPMPMFSPSSILTAYIAHPELSRNEDDNTNN